MPVAVAISVDSKYIGYFAKLTVLYGLLFLYLVCLDIYFIRLMIQTEF